MAGAATVGRLIIDMAADVAQLRTDMATATGVVQSAGTAIATAANVARTALGALGIAFSASEVKQWAEQIVSSTASLNDFAQKTGSSVENLSRLANQAAVSGKDFGSLEQLTLKLAVNMRDMGDETKGAGAALAYLGVTSRDPAEALLQVAVAMEQYADGAGKAALAKDLFGKNGPQYIDFLHDLAQAHAVGATRTAEQARAADELEESWRRVKVEGTFFADIILNTIVPALQREVDLINIARKAGLSIWDWGKSPLAFGDDISKLNERISETTAELDRLKAAGTTAWSALGIAAATQSLAQYNADLAKYSTLRDQYIEQWVGRLGYVGDKHDQMVKNSAASLSKLVSDYKGTAEAIKAADFTTTINSFGEELDKLTGADGGMSNYAKAMNMIIAAQKEGKAVTRDMQAALLAVAGELDNATRAKKDWDEAIKAAIARSLEEEKALRAYEKAVKDAEDAAAKFSRTLKDIVQASADEVATLGMSADQIRIVNAAREIDRRTREKILELGSMITDATREQILLDAEEAKASIAASTAKVAAYRDWLDLMQTTAGGVKDFLLDFVEHGSSAFKRMWENFKNLALEALAEIAAKQIVVSIVGALGLGGSVGAQAAGGIQLGQGANLLSSLFGGGGGAGNILSNLGSFTGLTNLGAGGIMGAGGALNSFALGNIGQSLGLSAAGLDTAGGVALTGLGEAVGAAVPIIGTALAIYSLGKQFGLWDKSGGPMTRQYGMAGGDLGAFGDLSSLHKLVGTDASQTGAYNSAAGGLLSTYQALARLLGVDPGSASFAVYSSSDPKGTAPSNVDVRANVGGQQVYAGDNANVGRSDADISAEITRQGQLAILNALKATDLPAIVKEFLGLVDLGTQTFDAIVAAAAAMVKLPEELQRMFVDAIKIDPTLFDRLSGFNQAFADLSAALDAGDAAVKAYKDGVVETTETVYEKADRLNSALLELATNYDGSTEQTAALATATTDYIGAMSDALRQITQIRQGLETMFGDSIRQIDMAIMTTVERSAFLKNEALANIELLKKTTDPTQIEKLGKIINTDLMAVFNMLSPEEQKRQQAWFVQQLTLAGDTADAQLVKSGNTLSGTLDIIRTKLADAATMQYNAAIAFGVATGTISEAAAQMLIAANTPIKTEVEVKVENNGNTTTTTTTVDNQNYVSTGAVEGGGWGWAGNPDPNVIYATPGP